MDTEIKNSVAEKTNIINSDCYYAMSSTQKEKLKKEIDKFFDNLFLKWIDPYDLFDLAVDCDIVSRENEFFKMSSFLDMVLLKDEITKDDVKYLLHGIEYKNFKYSHNYFYFDNWENYNSFNEPLDFYCQVLNIQYINIYEELKSLFKKSFYDEVDNENLEKLAEKIAFIIPVEDYCPLRDFVIELAEELGAIDF